MARKIRENTNQCDDCGGRTIGLTISRQGGARVLSVGHNRSPGIYCKACGTTRIHAANASEKRQAELKRSQG